MRRVAIPCARGSRPSAGSAPRGRRPACRSPALRPPTRAWRGESRARRRGQRPPAASAADSGRRRWSTVRTVWVARVGAAAGAASPQTAPSAPCCRCRPTRRAPRRRRRARRRGARTAASSSSGRIGSLAMVTAIVPELACCVLLTNSTAATCRGPAWSRGSSRQHHLRLGDDGAQLAGFGLDHGLPHLRGLAAVERASTRR